MMVDMLVEFLSRFATISDRFQWFFCDKIDYSIGDLGQNLEKSPKILKIFGVPQSRGVWGVPKIKISI